MKHITILLMLTLLCLAAWVADAQERSYQAPQTRYFQWSESSSHHQSSCRVQSSGLAGSGVYLDYRGLCGVLTAAHVVSGEATCTFPNGVKVSGRTTVCKHRTDVAFVFIGKPQGVKPLSLADKEPSVGDWVETLGYGGPQTKLRHYIGKVRDINGTYTHYTQSVINGDSGGPILDIQHKIVGVQATGLGGTVGQEGQWPVYEDSGGPSYRPIRAFLDRVWQSGWR